MQSPTRGGRKARILSLAATYPGNVVRTIMREFDADLDGFLQFISFARMS
jgi:hypothetical protein